MSTYLQMQDEVLAYGFDANVYRTRIKVWLNDAQSEIARRVEIPELFTFQTLATTTASQEVTLNTDIISIDSVVLTASGGDRVSLSPGPYKDVIINSDSLSKGQPEDYAINTTTIAFNPWPDAVYPFTVYYYRRPVDLSADVDVSIVTPDYHKAMIRYTVAEAYMAEDDQQMHAYHMARFESALSHLAEDRQSEINDGPQQVPGTWGAFQ